MGVETGDKGQRYEIRFHRDAADEPQEVLGWTDDLDQAERMASSWRLRPSTSFTWIRDREAGVVLRPHDVAGLLSLLEAEDDGRERELAGCDPMSTEADLAFWRGAEAHDAVLAVQAVAGGGLDAVLGKLEERATWARQRVDAVPLRKASRPPAGNEVYAVAEQADRMVRIARGEALPLGAEGPAGRPTDDASGPSDRHVM